MMSQDILLDSELHHLGGLTHRASSYLFWAADFQILCTAVSATWNCPHVRANAVTLIIQCVRMVCIVTRVLTTAALVVLSRFYSSASFS